NVGVITYAREWNPREREKVDSLLKSRRPPGDPPSGLQLAAADTLLVPGMPIQAGWMGKWEPAEVISVHANGYVLVKYDPKLSIVLMPRTRSWIAVAPETLKIAAESPEKFKPSVSVRPGGYAVIPPNFVQVDDNTPLLPGTPLKMESGLRWEDVTLIQVTEGGNLQIKRKSPPFRHRSKDLVQRSQVMIEKVTLEKLKQPGAEKEFAFLLEAAENSDSFTDDNHFGFGLHRARGLRKSHYPINIPIPSSAVLLTDEMPVKVGTKLGACWGHSWYDVTVKDIDADGNLIIGWDGYSDGWDGVMDRDQLVIKKTVLAKLEEDPPKQMAKAPPASSKPKDADKPQTGDRFRLVLKSHGNRKIPVTKVVVDITGIDLKEAGEYVDSCPITLKQNLSKQDAESLRKKLESAGAEVALELQ
ncbi:MAG: ribosomal protein L7/L12, partial [Planctomycetaceae bacterium]|nr:ribosomal protein L7/L12 [Planctomycetaceae bacterium]